VLEILGDQLAESVVLRVGPKMGVKPRELVSSRSAECCPKDGFVRVEDFELTQQLLGLSEGLGR